MEESNAVRLSCVQFLLTGWKLTACLSDYPEGGELFKRNPRFPGTIKAARLRKTVWNKGNVFSAKLKLGIRPHFLKFLQSENFVTRTRGLKIQYATSV